MFTTLKKIIRTFFADRHMRRIISQVHTLIADQKLQAALTLISHNKFSAAALACHYPMKQPLITIDKILKRVLHYHSPSGSQSQDYYFHMNKMLHWMETH